MTRIKPYWRMNGMCTSRLCRSRASCSDTSRRAPHVSQTMAYRRRLTMPKMKAMVQYS